MESTKSEAQCEAWIARVHSLQQQRMTPEARQRILAQAEQQQQREMSRRKVKAVKSHAMRSRALCAEGLRQMSVSDGGDFNACQERYQLAQAASEARQNSALQALSAPAIPEAVEVSMNEDDDEEQGMAEVAALVGASDAQALSRDAQATAEPGAGGAGDDVSALLAQLRTEPADAAECAAKFQLYEEYGKQVEKMRTSLFDLHRESEPTLPVAVNADMKKQLKRIDNAESMGIPDQVREWFVFHMMRAAETNNRNMAGILESFEKRLEFLAQSDQAECPICFENFVADTPKAAETLSCCHKVCKECWAHWASIAHPPFCPLCKHEEFLGFVIGRAGGSSSA